MVAPSGHRPNAVGCFICRLSVVAPSGHRPNAVGCFICRLSHDSQGSARVLSVEVSADGRVVWAFAVKVLVLHALRQDSRLTNIQYALCFARHLDGCEVTYVNVFGRVPQNLNSSGFDLVVLTYEVLAQRAMPFWRALTKRLTPIMDAARVRVVIPQDDYSYSAYLDEFVADRKVDFVFSAVTQDLHMLYPRSIACGVQFHEALTGYWEPQTSIPISSFRRPFKERSTDVGQRVRFLPPQFGPVAQRKGQLAVEFASLAKQAGFRCDVSTSDSDVLIGDAWWKFLGDVRFTIARRGGASIADPMGRLQTKVTQLELRRPSITHDEIARILKVNRLPQGDFTAISPRLFECAAMGVCQVLEEAHYFDGFQPWRDYIPLAPDMSNSAEVFETMQDWSRCEEIAASAEDVLIRSGLHSYRQFVKRFMDICTGHDIDGGGAPVFRDIDDGLFPDYDSEVAEQIRASARLLVIRGRNGGSDAVSEVARQWVDCFRRKELIVESFTIPWCAARSLLGTS